MYSAPNKFYVLETFFNFKIDYSKNLDDNLDVFKKLVQDIINYDKMVSETMVVILLNPIPGFYKEVKMKLRLVGTLNIGG